MSTREIFLSVLTAAASLSILCIATAPASDHPRIPEADPAEVNVDPNRLAFIDKIVEEGLWRDRMRGCVVLVGVRGHIVHRKAYGQRVVEPEPEEMTVDTVFDLASLTKPAATATSVMLLVEEGKVHLDEPACTYLPEFTGDGKEAITVRQLLTHQSGLIADNALADYLDGPEQAWERICNLGLVQPPGEKFIYTDVGFIVLGKLVERISGQPLNEFARRRIYQPLGMHETGFLPPEDLRPRIAPTEKHGGEWLRGTVHDPRSREMGGVAGHAGLYSTADDLALYAQMLIDDGRRGDVQLLKPETIELMNTPHETTGGLRSLGWDKKSVYSSNRGDLMSEQAFGHGGFTGTAMWIDPPQELFVIFLSSRLHPGGKGSVNELAGRIGTVAAAALLPQ
jgi:CubicO group peptidase (beta-lactamase class C family)